MTNHNELAMFHEDRRITDPEMLRKILDSNYVCTLALHDEPYPYIVPMNYGYVWGERLTFYLHMAVRGHRIDLLKKDPHVCLNVHAWLDRVGHAAYRKESHDYRSITAFGTAEIVSPGDNEEEVVRGISILCAHNKRPDMEAAIRNKLHRLLLLKVPADIVIGKAQYPVKSPDEVAMPDNFD